MLLITDGQSKSRGAGVCKSAGHQSATGQHGMRSRVMEISGLLLLDYLSWNL